jgi:hypothetical protein
MRDRSHALRSGDAAGGTRADAPTPGRRTLTESLPGGGEAAPASVRKKVEAATGADLSGVRVHDDADAHGSAADVSARAYTVGQDIFMGAGQRADGSPEGDRLMAHELVHTVQQRGTAGSMQRMSLAVTSGGDASEHEADRVADAALAGQPAGPVTQRGPEIARVGEGEAPAAQAEQASRQEPYMGFTPELGDVATQPVEPMDTVGAVDVPSANLYARKPPHAPIATVTSGTTLVVKGLIRPSGGSKPPVYLVLYHGRMVMKQSEQTEVLIPLSELAVTTNGPAKAQPTAGQTANDWMTAVPEKGQAGDPEALKPVLGAIREARAAIVERKLSHVAEKPPDQPREGYKSEDDDKTKDYDKWLRNKDTHPTLAKSPDDVRWNVLRRFFAAEGRPSDMMTYDSTNITWGPGFAGMGVGGITEQAMARLFNQSPEAKDAFWKVGITVVGVDLVMVNIKDAEKGLGEKLHGTVAENVLRLDKKLISFFINVSQGLTEPGQTSPSQNLRQDVLDSHFETFLNTTLRGSEGIIDGMEEMAAAVAAHSVHSGNHSWGQFRGATALSDVEGRINSQIANLKQQQEQGKKVGYIVPLAHIKRNLDRKFIDE